ncbi:MAG: hypothetical protein ACKPKO_60720, partial [Candidatus Fonsibacter sp.]
MAGKTVHGCTLAAPFPWPRASTELPAFILVKAYVSIWETVEQRTLLSSPVFKGARALPETPMMLWQSWNGICWETAPPYTLHVPPVFRGALNMAQPLFSWAQSLVVAMHYVKLAFGDNVTY